MKIDKRKALIASTVVVGLSIILKGMDSILFKVAREMAEREKKNTSEKAYEDYYEEW